MRRSILLGFLSVAIAAVPALALAQAAPQYMSSEPEDGAELHKAPDQVTVTFNEPLDSSSQLVVENHCGDRLDDKKVEVSLNEMTVGIAKKPGGHYIVVYSAVGVGGVTGTNTGSFSFEVHAGEECTGGAHHHGGEVGQGHEGHEGGAGHEGHSGEEGHGAHQQGHAGHSAGEHEGHSPTEHAGHLDHAAGEHANHSEGQTLTLAEQRKRRYGEIATGESAFPPLAPDTPAVFMSLGLAAGFGLIGGWVLRVSSPK
jgi:methionine-rich copper-binding protein CopC